MRVRAIDNRVTEIMDDGEIVKIDPPTFLPITIGNVYRVIDLSPGSYSIIDDTGQFGGYEKRRFEVSDASEPADWITYEWSTPEERFAGPACFWQCFHMDLEYGKNGARRVFERRIARWLTGED